MQVFQNLRVLDFSQLLPGPFVSLYLADWGADVLRVQAVDRPDLMESLPPFVEGRSVCDAFINRFKSKFLVDLKTAEGREAIRERLAQTDVVIESFRPGVMKKLGLAYEDLRASHPKLIYCSLSGYGQTGPYAQRAGHDINYAALSGLAAMTGTAQDGPVLHGNPVCDINASMHALFAIATALYHREKSGEGQYIDVSIADCGLMLSSLWLSMRLGANYSAGHQSEVLNGSSFYGYYRCRDGLFLSVGALEAKFLRIFLEGIGGLNLLETGLSRTAVQELIQEKNRDEWLRLFADKDACLEPVLGMDEIPVHPLFRERGVFCEIKEKGRSLLQLAPPLRFSSIRPRPQLNSTGS